MKKIMVVLSMLLLLLLTSACVVSFGGFEADLTRTSGEVIEKEFDIEAVEAVEIDGFGVMHYRVGDTPSLEIEAEEGYLDNLEVIVTSSRLIIRPERTWLGGFVATTTPHYYLTLPSLEELTLSGAVKFNADEMISEKLLILCNGGNDLTIEQIEAADVTLKAAGAAIWTIDKISADDIEIEINGMTNAVLGDMQAESFELVINGAASATVAGDVQTQMVEINGTGTYEAGDLRSSDVTVKVSGASSIIVWAVDDLHLDCDGAGKIDYWGAPRVTQDNAGLTVINSLGEKED
ncbi:MAG: DUF2807 domain-containing protein [Anaerolineae bacterium]|jgi:hypothetical protein|nr:DUF2807 domain-containing protein [Anaerolineae bacterium]